MFIWGTSVDDGTIIFARMINRVEKMSGTETILIQIFDRWIIWLLLVYLAK